MEQGKSESAVSRDHTIFWTDDGLISIAGGKLTTFRRMAEDLFTRVEEKEIFPKIARKKRFSRQKYAIGLDKQSWSKILKESGVSLDEEVANHIYEQYGRGAIKILELIKSDKSLKDRIDDENEFIAAEIVYGLKYEPTPHLIDIFCRRTEMSLFIDHKKQLNAAKKVADLMAQEYDWSDQKKTEEINLYMDHIKKTVVFIK